MSNSLEKIAFHTLGCKLNFSETSTMVRDFINRGFSIVKDFENANIHIINTCSVTDKADKKAKKIINKIIQTSDNPYITVLGCYAQLKPNQIANLNGVNLVIGDKEKLNVVNHVIKNYNKTNVQIIHSPINDSINFKSSFSMNDRVRSYLKIQDGCDYPCTYCTIPKARGKSRNDSIQNILKNVKILENNNISEVVITGVNIGDYGRTSKNESLFHLLKKINAFSSINRFRISSIEPNLLTKEIINFIKGTNSFLPHFHIPLQSGNDKILKLMRRKYNLKMYQDKINIIKGTMPDACIGADVIVGFPGETNKDFEKTYNFIEQLKINYLHVFSYSNRTGTVASELKSQISKNVKISRSRSLQKLSNKMRFEFYKNNINQVRKVLFESIVNDEYIVGFTDNYIRVMVKGDESMIKKIFNVKLLFVGEDKVFGEIY
jgi:threonylcarbamoyladenosine tRNA methylthiotransferase MtaB